ncbi:MAG: CRTAC1 family protein, partial [Planctomycetes bacterium]|nr:CRTAC1 family protein [Planctomycetota bacterium]
GRTQIREVHSAGSFFSQSDPRACFGLGSAATIDVVEIRWPSGVTSRLESVNADQHLTLREE